jgi:hypothetical protein
VAELVCKLANLPTNEEFADEVRIAKRNEVVKIYYRKFDFLPKQVLDSLMLLEIALDNPDRGPYKLEGNCIIPLLKTEIVQFIEDCTIIENGKYSACIMLNSNNDNVVKNEVIRLHARKVLYTLNKFATIGRYMTLTQDLRKQI